MLSRFDTIPYTNTHTCEEIPPPSSQRLAAPQQSEPTIEEALAHKLYPNPNNGSFTLWLQIEELDVSNIIVWNLTGQKVYANTVINGENQINLDVSNGLYLYAVTVNEKVTWTGKVSVGMD